ncbi:MAG TPA: glycosyltransferase family 39 protein, partial [Planctomycetia bacterium]|nr:glycosyltransferase family 39 protein [Planctomycetia bacterium]
WEKTRRIERWHRDLGAGPEARNAALSEAGLKVAWPFCVKPPDENPPVYCIVSHLTWRLGEGLLGEVAARRLSSILLFAGVAAGITLMAAKRWGTIPALMAAGAWVIHPRIFTHARVAAIDMPLAAFWFFGAAACLRAGETGKRVWLVGPLLGLAVMSKFTGVLAVPALVCWLAVYARTYFWRITLVTAILLPVTMIAAHPGWWLDPWSGIATAIEVHKTRHLFQMVPTWYFGQVYDHSLPWHNSLVLPLVCSPPVWAGLALAGIGCAITGGLRDRFVGWIGLNWSALIIMRATPLAPGHDGIRQLLASFPYFALLAGYGAFRLQSALPRGRQITLGLLIAGSAAGIGAWWRLRPAELSYYSEAIGGLRGARSLGLESTYWWECADGALLLHMNKSLPEGAKIGLSSHYLQIFGEYQRLGRLRKDMVFVPLQELAVRGPDLKPRLAPVDYLIILNREGMLKRRDRPPITPILEELEWRLAGPAEFTVEREGVRLLALVKVTPDGK